MKWKKIMVMTQPEAEEIITGVFLGAGAQGVNVQGYVAPEGSIMPGDYLDDGSIPHEPFGVSAFFAIDGGEDAAFKAINGKLEEIKAMDLGVPLGSLEVIAEDVDEADWENEWKAYFKPARISDYFVIKPTWEEYEAAEDEIVIEIDPGMAFGTGTHESTRMCVKLLEEYVEEGSTVLDVGCGSGILGIAALKLGAGRVYAMDFDSVAVKVAKSNLELNGVEDRAEVFGSDLLDALGRSVKADVVVANIIADVVIRLAPSVPEHIKSSGMFICSGIIDSRIEDVERELEECGFRIIKVLEEGEWRAIACKYRK